ncbi:MAG: hypothetical protein Q7U54_18630 [Bacteroidales bacterium]|nr:hypothetical protein [Bacteroidales bacterium]
MKQKRPRLPQRNNTVDRQENSVFDNTTTENKATIEDKFWSKGKLPDIEMDEVTLKDAYEPAKKADFHLVTEIEPIGIRNASHDASNTKDLKDIYNSIQLEDSF